MYEGFYQLNADPFRLSPDHRFCFAHHSYAKAKAYIEYGLHRAEGLVAITGSPGTGKSTLVEDLLAGLNSSRTVVARLVTTQLRATDLLRMLAFEFKIRAEGMDKATLLRSVEGHLAAQVAAGRRVLIIVDEAQDLSADALEELRLLTNLQAKGRPLVQVFLLGQDQLHRKITSPDLEQLRQRLVAVSRLAPMTLEETHAYICHRLKQAGWTGDPEIAADAVQLIYKHSKGVPRLVNHICSRLLLHGSLEEKHRLDGGDAQAVINELAAEAPQLRDEAPPQSVEPLFSTPAIRLSDIKLSSLESAAYGRADQTLQRGGASKAPAVAASTVGFANDQTPDENRATGETKAQATNAMHGSRQAATTRAEPKSARIVITILLTAVLCGTGILAIAGLESEPFGYEPARWSRALVIKIQDAFMGIFLDVDKENVDTSPVVPPARNATR